MNIFVKFLMVIMVLFSGCIDTNDNSVLEVNSEQFSDVLYQVSTINALMEGLYDGFIPVSDLLTHGDFGIGTFDKLDGEMVVLDGICYQIKADGVAYTVENVTTPFAVVTWFENDETYYLNDMNISEFESYFESKFPSKNMIYAVKLTGNFSKIKTRSVSPQEKTYEKLADVVKNQSIFEFENVSGTCVGFWIPDFMSGLNVPLYHLHFITDDRTAGGHILDFEINSVEASFDITPEFYVILPTSEEYYGMEFSDNLENDIKIVEKQ
ncbi:Acetolactate decarboxylase [Methanococcus vannielii SB]|uniref:Alpha-acetolactate decarboxylase n=1 Tax=Methanococcus vannielii (strain ATCC 35089 / DSM 1224 / JCM 13029 / OCM 148 / SB) TaxID=406327 RepID=A6USA8_METVS|nr:acetolactate decarboxylase [Methanococcus vannielii]ABR55380.1 Acetolactate decarboxylase [Methanococcus vannielii SB]